MRELEFYSISDLEGPLTHLATVTEQNGRVTITCAEEPRLDFLERLFFRGNVYTPADGGDYMNALEVKFRQASRLLVKRRFSLLGYSDMKNHRCIQPDAVECPVRGCSHKASRQRGADIRSDAHLCPLHGIYLSASTFEYEDFWDNILWKEESDKSLLQQIASQKRETHRLGRERSEDAVTWNVFRYLEKEHLLDGYLRTRAGASPGRARAMYWSYSQEDRGAWPRLKQARRIFGEFGCRGSEPDIIVETERHLFFIECKLTSGNKTIPSDTENPKQYKTGAGRWFRSVFRSDYETTAIDQQKYELLRYWLLGTWIAEQEGLRFHLVNLVPESREKDIEDRFLPHIRTDAGRIFARATWEDLYRYIEKSAPEGIQKTRMMDYMRNKTAGYTQNGILRKAFSL